MNERPRIPADFNNVDADGRVRLNLPLAARVLEAFDPPLAEGTKVTVYDDELEARGVLEFSTDEAVWVARVKWEQKASAGPAFANDA